MPKDLLKLTATVVDKATGSPAGIQRMGDITCSGARRLKASGRVPGGDRTEKAPTVKRAHRRYLFMVARNFIQASIPAWADFSSTPCGNPATPTPPTRTPSRASGTPPPTR